MACPTGVLVDETGDAMRCARVLCDFSCNAGSATARGMHALPAVTVMVGVGIATVRLITRLVQHPTTVSSFYMKSKSPRSAAAASPASDTNDRADPSRTTHDDAVIPLRAGGIAPVAADPWPTPAVPRPAPPPTDSTIDDGGSELTDEDDAAPDLVTDDAAESLSATRLQGQDEAPIEARVPTELAGQRLDKVLARLFSQYSRSRLQAWLDDGRVEIDARVAGKRDAPSQGAIIVVRPRLSPEQQAFVAEPLPLDVVYENDALLVVDKPAGLVVHPGAGHWTGTLLNGLLDRYGAAAAALPRAGIVHRLDKDTSGLMVVARTLQAQTDLVRQLQARTVKRQYLALVWGRPPARGTIDAPIGRDSRDRLRMAFVEGAGGKPARTHFVTLGYGVWQGRPVAALRCDLETGRTHQIRVHCRHIGHPLLGDLLYMRGVPGVVAASPIARQALHAWRLALVDPLSGDAVHWTSRLPSDILDAAQHSGLPMPALEHLDQ